MDVKIRNIYIRNSNTGIIYKVANYTERTTLTPTGINNECRCRNVLEQADFIVITDNLLINDIYVDVVLKEVHVGDCSQRMFLSFTTSVKFVRSFGVSF